MLADLLDDNAVIHQVYPWIGEQDDWAGNLRKAAEHIRSLQVRTAHQETRVSCQLLLAALASLEKRCRRSNPLRS
jgi:hypothetical protein